MFNVKCWRYYCRLFISFIHNYSHLQCFSREAKKIIYISHKLNFNGASIHARQTKNDFSILCRFTLTKHYKQLVSIDLNT